MDPELDQLFAAGNRALLNNELGKAAEAYLELAARGRHAAVTHNLALTYALTNNASEAMDLLESNRKDFPMYLHSFLLAAELLRRGAKAKDAPKREMLEAAAELLKTPAGRNMGHPQTCIVASEICAAIPGLRSECMTWHKQALAAIRFRSSKLTPVFQNAFIDDLQDREVHYFSMPPEEPVLTGALHKAARDSGKVLAVVHALGAEPALPEGLAERWTVVRVSYSPAPARTEEGRLHARTPFAWAARYCAAGVVADADVHTGVVWEPAAGPWDDRVHGSQALVTAAGGAADPLALFCVKPVTVLEVRLLQELFQPRNVPPVDPSPAMAGEVFTCLTKDSELDVEYVT